MGHGGYQIEVRSSLQLQLMLECLCGQLLLWDEKAILWTYFPGEEVNGSAALIRAISSTSMGLCVAGWISGCLHGAGKVLLRDTETPRM